MKRARRIKPQNPLAMAPIMKKGGAHARKDKRAARARQKARQRREFSDAE
ncbi:MAG: hypothetical protein Q8J72_11350 [Rhodocyclaceae bacterium]|nr:hypothetical protein [Rhodocyclaceae bacterium]MDP2196567.1 hypothetical protein [Rhodocyclaceae bacterium]